MYDTDDLAGAFRTLGVERGGIVYVISALWRMPGFSGPPNLAPNAFYEGLRQVLGDEGTIVVPTHSQNLCNTDVTFDPQNTPSVDRGIFSEFVRLLPGARRSFHPFNSYAALGPMAEALTADAPRHAYGPFSPESRMIDHGALVLNIGVPPNICTTVHHVEQTMSVPYRYTKEFMQPVVRDGSVSVEPFYLYVWYREADLVRSQNKPLFKELREKIDIRDVRVDRGTMHSYRIDDFFEESLKIFNRSPYVWCAAEPTIRPWRK
jgi:aminoglycoside 3-N-acetyltransferase